MALLVVSGMGKFTAYSSSGVGNDDIFAKFPNAMRVLLGIGNFDVASIGGFFAFLFPYVEITAAIHAALLGSGIIAKEERDKTTEFLITRPVSRSKIITSKLLAAFLNIAIINIVCILTSLAIVPVFSKGENINKEILLFYFVMFLVQLIYLSLGAFVAAALRKPKTSGTITTNILLAGFVISKVTDLVDNLDVLNIVSPFKYFSLEKIVNGNEVSIPIALISVVMAAVFIVFTYYFYQKRDLNI